MRCPVDVSTDKVRDYTGSRPSAVARVRINSKLMLTELELMGDEQAEAEIHDGPNRTLHHYSREHYQHWRQAFPGQAELFVVPAFGEDLSTEGLTEDNVYIGDTFQWGEALTQVMQPHSPYFKLNFHSGISDMVSRMQDAGKTGWLYSVIAPGQVSTDAPLVLALHASDVSMREAIAIAWHTPFDDSQYHRLLSITGLSKSWIRAI